MYTFTSVRQILMQCLENIGVIVDNNAEDINFQLLGMDSIMFIMFIAEVEDTLNIALPTEYLFFDDFVSLNGFAERILLTMEDN